jgi:hypothetical protein
MEKLNLKNSEPFGVGGRRECYVHPLYPNKCVKVLRTDDKSTTYLKRPGIFSSLFRKEYNNNENEYRTLKSIEKRIGKNMQRHVPLCYGYEPTDLGPGLVLDLVRDADGKISRSLRELLFLGHSPDEFKKAFDEFEAFLIQNNIMTRNLLDHNLVASIQQDKSWKIHIIDGLGDPSWLPLARWSRALGRRKIKRKARRAWANFNYFFEVERKAGLREYQTRNNKTWSPGILKHR